MSSGHNKPPKSVSGSDGSQRKEKNNLNRRKTSVNSNLDETTLIGCFAFYCKITVRRSTKDTSEHIERFIINRVEDEEVTTKVNEEVEEYKKNYKEQFEKKPENRYVEKTKQNLYFKHIIKYLKQRKNAIGIQKTKSATSTKKRKRFNTINGQTLEECRNFGRALNHYLVSNIPVIGKKKDNLLTITTKMVEDILQDHPMSFPQMINKENGNI